MKQKGLTLIELMIGVVIFSTAAILVSGARVGTAKRALTFESHTSFDRELKTAEQFIRRLGRQAFQCRKLAVPAEILECDIEFTSPPTGLLANRQKVRFNRTPFGLSYEWQDATALVWVQKDLFPHVTSFQICDCNDMFVAQNCNLSSNNLNQILITAGKCNGNIFRFQVTGEVTATASASSTGPTQVRSYSGAFFARNSLYQTSNNFVFQW